MRLAVLCNLSIALLGTGAWATTHHVPGEYATIQAGVDAAAAGDTVLVAPGVYSDLDVRFGASTLISACLFLKDDVVVRSSGGASVTTIDRLGADTTGVATVVYATALSGAGTALEGFHITGNPGNNPAITAEWFAGDLRIRGCLLDNFPGGGFNLRYTSVVVQDCTVACGGAQGLFSLGSNLEVENCIFDGNSPGIKCDGDDIVPPQHLTVRNSIFRNNTASSGAAIVVADYFDGVLVEECVFENNTAEAGGAIRARGSGSKIVRNSLFVGNRAEGTPFSHGGSIYLTSNHMEVEGNTIVGSYQEEPDGGAALFMLGATNGSFVRDNIFASSTGAPAIRLYSGQMDTSCNVFWNNEEGDIVGVPVDPTDLIADPLFCNPPAGDYTVSSASPCLPENNPNCADLIGAYGPGCGFVSIEPMSWGRLKGIYRTGE